MRGYMVNNHLYNTTYLNNSQQLILIDQIEDVIQKFKDDNKCNQMVKMNRS